MLLKYFWLIRYYELCSGSKSLSPLSTLRTCGDLGLVAAWVLTRLNHWPPQLAQGSSLRAILHVEEEREGQDHGAFGTVEPHRGIIRATSKELPVLHLLWKTSSFCLMPLWGNRSLLPAEAQAQDWAALRPKGQWYLPLSMFYWTNWEYFVVESAFLLRSLDSMH